MATNYTEPLCEHVDPTATWVCIADHHPEAPAAHYYTANTRGLKPTEPTEEDA